MKLLILNGSPSGADGNCAVLSSKIQTVVKSLKFDSKPVVIHLQQSGYSKNLKKKILEADAVLIVTGTYWDSWGSPLQKFLEEATELEAHSDLIGKPAGVVVLMHSVGGKGVLSRLQGVLSTFGFLIPPFAGMTLSLAGQLAASKNNVHAEDFWCVEDLEVLLRNLQTAASMKSKWSAWPVDRKNFRKTWLR